MSALITSNGLNWVLNKTFGSTSETVPARWEFGIDGTTASTSDTTCLGRVPITYTVHEACDAVAGWAQGGDGGAPVQNTTGYVEGSACLNIPITDNTHVSTWTKTVAALDIDTVKKAVYVFLYVEDTGNIAAGADGIVVFLGDGGVANSYEYNFNKTSLTAGQWNVLRIPDYTDYDVLNGAPDPTGIDTFRLEIKSTGDYSGTELRMDAWIYAAETTHYTSCEAGYPTVVTTNHTSVWQIVLTPSQCKGFYLQRIFLKNSSATPMDYLSANYTSAFKTGTKQFTYKVIQTVVNA